jgi:hypothetical protein
VQQQFEKLKELNIEPVKKVKRKLRIPGGESK